MKSRLELEKANAISRGYNESLLRLRKNKNIFFSMISNRLSIPFNELTDKLNILHKHTLKRFEVPVLVKELISINSILLIKKSF